MTYTTSLIVLLAFVFRIDLAASYTYSSDELMHLFIASGASVSEVVLRGLTEMHPPFGAILRFFILKCAAHDPLSQRAFGIVLSLLMIVSLSRVSKKLGGEVAGLAATVVCAFMPIVVTLSSTIRNYVFLGLFESFLLLAFVEYLEHQSRKWLALYSLLLFLVCATHFSGFIIAAALLPVLVFSNGGRRKKSHLVEVFVAHLPLLGLGLVLMYLHFVQTNFFIEWLRFFQNNPSVSSIRAEELSIFWKSISLYYGFFSANKFAILVLLSLTLAGFYALFKANRAVALGFFLIYLLHALLAYFKLYPLTGNRYCYDLAPLLAVLLSLGIGKLWSPFPKPLHLVACVALASAVLSLFLLRQRIGADNPEFPMTNADYAVAEETLRVELPPNQDVVTNKAGALEVLYLTTGGKTSYQTLDGRNLQYGGHDYRYFADANQWEYPDEKRFQAWLQPLVSKRANAPESRLTFMVLKKTDFSMVSLFRCLTNHADKRFVRMSASYLFYDASVNELEELMMDKTRSEECFSASRVPRLAGAFAKAGF